LSYAALDEQREKEIALYQKQLDDMRSTAEEKLIPKSQFHEEISTLKGRLSSKEKDIQLAKQQIKQCKLEIENNEEILTKFFKASTNHTHTAPDIFINTPKKKDYKIKKNRVSVSAAGGLLDLPGKSSNVTSMECLDKVANKDF
jgi:chromosome segregation ATPase